MIYRTKTIQATKPEHIEILDKFEEKVGRGKVTEKLYELMKKELED